MKEIKTEKNLRIKKIYDPINDKYLINAKDELLLAISNKPSLKCAFIIDKRDRGRKIILKKDYSKSDLKDFYEKLDFYYDNGYGLPLLEGVVCFKDGSWLIREEYDGAEWWEYKINPEILIAQETRK
jgi:hypothetical protein